MADTRVNGSRDSSVTDLAEECDKVRIVAQEAQFAAVEGRRQEFTDAIERLQDEHSRLRLAYRAWLATGGPVLERTSL